MSAERIIEIALAEVGYLEKKSNSQLNDKTANAGTANWTKYGVWYGDYTGAGSSFYNTYWCAMFVSWCSNKAGTGDATGYFAYCPYWVSHFKNKGQWVTSNPKAGDIIFFHSGGTANHVGLVYKVSGTTVYTVEGNTSSGNNTVVANGGGVFTKSYSTSNSRILGYGRPKYIIETDNNGCPYGKGTSLLKKGSTGIDVYRLQWYLNEYGYNTNGIDGQFGDATLNAVKQFQSQYNLAIDGEVGNNTWNKLINNYQIDVKGELSMSQYTELVDKINELNSKLDTITQEYDYQISTVYTNLDVIKDKANWAYEAAQWAVASGIWTGTDDKGTLNKNMLDLKSIVELYRVKNLK